MYTHVRSRKSLCQSLCSPNSGYELNLSMLVRWCTIHQNSLFCANHVSPDMSTISGKWNLFICIKIPLPHWSVNAPCLLEFYSHEKWKTIWSERQAENEMKVVFSRKEALCSLLGRELFLGFCSTASSLLFAASISVSPLSSREEIINLSELLLTPARCVSGGVTSSHSSTQVQICVTCTPTCMQAYIHYVLMELYLCHTYAPTVHESMNPYRAAEIKQSKMGVI